MDLTFYPLSHAPVTCVVSPPLVLTSRREWLVRAPVLMPFAGAKLFTACAVRHLPVFRSLCTSVCRLSHAFAPLFLPANFIPYRRVFVSFAASFAANLLHHICRSSFDCPSDGRPFSQSAEFWVLEIPTLLTCRFFITTLRRSAIIRCPSIWCYLDESSISSNSVIDHISYFLFGRIRSVFFIIRSGISGHGLARVRFFFVFALNQRRIRCTSVCRNC